MRKHSLTRRQVIAGAAAGAAYSLVPGTVLGANDRVNIGVIGTGGQGSSHVKRFSKMSGVSVVAVCDADRKHMAKAPEKAGKHQDLRRLLDMKEIDAVVIATPNHWHSLAAIMACQAGKHVYVEKPVSHCIWEGRKMVEAARKYNRVVQAGTQHRSCPGVIACARDVQAGKYGKVLWVHCSKLGARSPIGKVAGPQSPPDSVDYDLWAGPAPKTPVMRKRFHYDWHWQWNWGDGEAGNWGPHYVDDLRHILGWDDIPTSAVAAGNRWWNDDGQTPNMHFCLMEHRGVKVVLDIRNMRDPDGGGKSGAVYLGSRGGNYIQCERAYIRIARGGGWAYDKNGKRIKQYKGNGGKGHAGNFISAVRKGSPKSLNCEIEIGHLSTAMCHLANIAYRVGARAPTEQVRDAMKGHKDALNTLESMLAQLGHSNVNLKAKPFILGPVLTYDNKREQFTGDSASAANKLVRLASRRPFIVPEKV